MLRSLIIHLAIFLSACGGTTVQPPVTPAPSFAARDAQAQSLVALYDISPFTDLATLPANGTASYDGFIGATLYNNISNRVTRIIGDASISVSFAPSQVTAAGSITAFQDETEGAMQGQLDLSAGLIDTAGDPTSDPTFTADASGSLRWPSGLSRQIDIVLEGDLRGQNHDALGGEVLGRHTATGGNGDVIGSFILDR